MIRISVDTRALDGLSRDIKTYETELPNESSKALLEIGMDIQAIAKTLAPKWKGILKNMIKLQKMSKHHIRISSTAPWAWYQEGGYRPHWVPLFKYPRAREWARSHGITGNWMKVRKFTPHMHPAVKVEMNRLEVIFDKHLKRAERKAKL